MRLTQPTNLAFVISIMLAMVALAAVSGFVPLAIITANTGWIFLAAYGVLAASVLLPGV